MPAALVITVPALSEWDAFSHFQDTFFQVKAGTALLWYSVSRNIQHWNRDFQVLDYRTVHLITGRNIFYNLLLILKCFTLESDLDHVYVFLHHDLSRKHFRHSSLFRTCFTSDPLKGQGGVISPTFPTQARKRNYLWRTLYQNTEKAEGASCSLWSIYHPSRAHV